MTEQELDDWYADYDYHKLGVSKKQLDNLRAWQQGAKNPRERKHGRSSEKEKSEGGNSRRDKKDFSMREQADFQFDVESESNYRR